MVRRRGPGSPFGILETQVMLHQGCAGVGSRFYADRTAVSGISREILRNGVDIGYAYGLLFGALSCNGRSLVLFWASELCGRRRLPAQSEPAVKHQQSVGSGLNELLVRMKSERWIWSDCGRWWAGNASISARCWRSCVIRRQVGVILEQECPFFVQGGSLVPVR